MITAVTVAAPGVCDGKAAGERVKLGDCQRAYIECLESGVAVRRQCQANEVYDDERGCDPPDWVPACKNKAAGVAKTPNDAPPVPAPVRKTQTQQHLCKGKPDGLKIEVN